MNKCIVVGKNFQFKGEEIPLTDLYTEDMYKYSNEQALKFGNDLFCVNESFSSLTQVYLAIEHYVLKNQIDDIDCSKADDILKLYLNDIAKKHSIKCKGSAAFTRVKIAAVSYSYMLASSLYLAWLMAKIPSTKESINVAEKFAVLRQKSAIQKFKAFTDIAKEYEDPYSKTSVYRFFPRIKRIGWALKSFFEARSTISKMHKFYGGLLGKASMYAFDNHYRKRVVHGHLYKHLMTAYLPNFKGCTYYTGSNLDRYSVIEWDIAKSLGIKTVCIPHGLEYGYRFPKGFSSDLFYANSEYAANHLNKLYNTTKYVFDESVTSRMFKLPNATEHEKMVVFFTEQQEYYVNQNILSALEPKLKEKGIKLYVKLHPGDTKAHYEGCDYNYITDYTMSLTHNICVSRKSTVLLEALYNDTTAIAIITTLKDKAVFETFPSLNSDKIIKTYNIDDLFDEIVKHY